MIATIEFWPEQGSGYAGRVDWLFIFLLIVATVFVALICISIVFFLIKYRHNSTAKRDRPRTMNVKLEIAWTVIPLILTMVMFTWGARLFFESHQPPAEAVEVDVVAKQWMWKLQHAEGNAEINTLHVPVGRPVKLRMISEDVIHSFYVPAFRVKQDVLPGRYTYTWFRPNRVGRYRLFCAEYCGTSHSQMIGWVVVMSPADYAEWLAGGSTHEPPAVTGKRLFEQYRCNTCHQNKETARCPPLEGLFGRPVRLTDGKTVVADEAYLRQSILDPQAQIVVGFRPLMPTFRGQISETEVLQIIAYLKTLGASGEKRKPTQRESGGRTQAR